jgi:hypothetical protein
MAPTISQYLDSVQNIPGLENCSVQNFNPIGTEHDSDTEYRAVIDISCVANDLDGSLEELSALDDLTTRSTQPLRWVKTIEQYCDLITPENQTRRGYDWSGITNNPFSSKKECRQSIDGAIDNVQTALNSQFPELAKSFAELQDDSKFRVLMDMTDPTRRSPSTNVPLLERGIKRFGAIE